MSLIKRVNKARYTLRRSLASLRGETLPELSSSQASQSTFEFQLPNPFGGEPLYRARISLTTTPNAHGETLRLQAHINGCLSMPKPQTQPHAPRAALPTTQNRGTSLVQHGQKIAGGLVRLGVSRLPAQLFAPILQQRVQTWIDIQASSAPLAAGAEALIPDRLRTIMREVPRTKPGEPRVAGWAGAIDGPYPGHAQFLHMQMDQTDLPPELRGKPFNLSASFASTLVDESEQR